MSLALLLRNWKLVLGGLALAAALLWGAAQKANAIHWQKKHDSEQTARAQAEATLAAKNAESEKRARQYAEAEAADAANRAEADKRWRSTEAKIAALRNIKGDGSCPVPHELAEALGDL